MLSEFLAASHQYWVSLATAEPISARQQRALVPFTARDSDTLVGEEATFEGQVWAILSSNSGFMS